jgi:hypothetical protein
LRSDWSLWHVLLPWLPPQKPKPMGPPNLTLEPPESQAKINLSLLCKYFVLKWQKVDKCNMDESGRYNVKWNNSGIEGQTPHDSFYLWSFKLTHRSRE